MTRYTEVGRIGPVEITAVDAELSDAPRTFMLDCDHAHLCEWGMVAVHGYNIAQARALEHAEHHETNGPDSTAWRFTFKRDDKELEDI